MLLPVLALIVLAVSVYADERAEREAELDALLEEIAEVRAALAADRERRDDVSARIERTERRIAEVAGEIRALDREIGARREKLADLEARRIELADEIADHQASLAGQLRSMHRMGRQPALRLLLRQDDPALLARATAYLDYLNRARVDAIDSAAALVEEAEILAREVAHEERRLADARRELANQREHLETARVERERLLARLEEDIADRGERLDQMEADRRRLEELLERLGTLLADIPESPLEEAPFASRDGRLAWPAEGSIRQRFGAARAGGRLRWQGIVIGAPAGETVRAVYHGRIVFADWLSGFGQLLIVDHHDGYMSLYGFNDRLLRREGDWVGPGEPIAAVGDSGGQREAGLYFEIRREGQPVDPLPWLSARN